MRRLSLLLASIGTVLFTYIYIRLVRTNTLNAYQRDLDRLEAWLDDYADSND